MAIVRRSLSSALIPSMRTKTGTARFGKKTSIVSTGSHPLTKMLQDSEYEIECRQEKLVKLKNVS